MKHTRSQSREMAILGAVNELLDQQGYERLSIDAVAAQAHASKTTIYTRWPDKASLVSAAVLARSREQPRLPWNARDLREDLVALVELCVHLAEAESLTTFMGLLAAAEDEPTLAAAVHETALGPRRQDCRDIVQRAIGRGEVSSPDVADRIFELVLGHILVRYVVEHRPLERAEQPAFVDEVVLPALRAAEAGQSRPA